MKLFYRFTRWCVKSYFHLFYRLKVYGIERIIPGKAIIAPNHTSFLDPPTIGVCWPEEIFFLARKSLFSSYLFGSLITHLNAFPVEGNTQNLDSMKIACRLLEENKKVVIFPEGVRSHDGELAISLKSGIGMLSLRCRAPIIPVYLAGCYEIWSRWRRFPKPWGKVVCTIGSPIYPENYAHLEKKEAQRAIAEQLLLSLNLLKQQTGAD